MKKSEAIQKISEWLLSNAPETYRGKEEIFRKADAAEFLEFLEAFGMQPPPVTMLSIGDVVIRSQNIWENSIEEEIKNDIL